MIRRPTPTGVAYAWWRAAIRGESPPRHDGFPECGFYRFRAVGQGPWLPARIWLEQEVDPETGELTADEVLRCESMGRERDPERLWLSLRPIRKAEYEALIDLHRQMDAMAATHAPIDLREVRHAAPQTWSY